LDKFDASKKIPQNRHRIPNIGDQNVTEKKRKISPADVKSYDWDMDGRRHPKPKKNKVVGQIIDQNQVKRVDLPEITSPQPI